MKKVTSEASHLRLAATSTTTENKAWNWRMISTMRGVSISHACRLCCTKWRAYGFDGKHQPNGAIAAYMDMAGTTSPQRMT
jgi:hypothetical protein